MRKTKYYTRLGLISLFVLGVLMLCGIWQRHQTREESDARFFDGITYASAINKNAEVNSGTEAPIATGNYGKEVEDYIKTIFGSQGRMAIAVAKGECQGLRPTCKLVSEVEYSVCAFQINLKAHGNKVPGNTLEDKERWLMEDHRHCTLIAKVIYDQSGFWPWTAYKNGEYRRFL